MSDVIAGYAVKFNDTVTIAGSFRERVAPGAFKRTLEQRDIVALLDHDTGRVLGRISAGTLRLKEDNVGLWFELDADATTPEGQSAIGNTRRQDIKGCSFGFSVKSEEWEDGGNRLPIRILREVDCHEITLTAFPAYPSTTAALVVANGGARSAARAEAAMRARGIATA